MDFYKKIRKEMRDWLASRAGQGHRLAEYLMLVPDVFHLLLRLMGDKDVPKGEKAKVGAALTYFVSPFDFFPEGIFGPAAFADDLALAIYVIHGLINSSHSEVLRRNWSGEKDILDVARSLVKSSYDLLGSNILKTKLSKLLPQAENISSEK
jgi:uncharacterized membrane protein YkvA (DUF1232 family)